MQTFTYSIKKRLYENEDSEASFSEVSKLKLEKAVALTRLKGWTKLLVSFRHNDVFFSKNHRCCCVLRWSQNPRADFLLKIGELRSQLQDGYVVFERNVSHMGCSECDTVRSLSNLEHLFYKSADQLQLIGNVLSLLNCAACGGDGSFCQSLPEVRHSATNSRFKKLFAMTSRPLAVRRMLIPGSVPLRTSRSGSMESVAKSNHCPRNEKCLEDDSALESAWDSFKSSHWLEWVLLSELVLCPLKFNENQSIDMLGQSSASSWRLMWSSLACRLAWTRSFRITFAIFIVVTRQTVYVFERHVDVFVIFR